VKVKLENQIHYIFHDVIQVGGRNLFNATHREKFGALVSIMRAIECNANLEHWPKFALAPAFIYNGHQPTNLFLKGIEHSTFYKNFQEKNIVYVKEQELLEQQKTNKETASKPERRPISLGTNKPNVSASTQQSGAAKQATNTATKSATKPETRSKRKNSKKKNNQRENVIIRPGKGGPDDYTGVSEDGKREGVVMVRTLALSLKLNKILRCEHFDLYRAPDQYAR
jgi:N-acetylmuramoyl-L-alanine amidase